MRLAATVVALTAVVACVAAAAVRAGSPAAVRPCSDRGETTGPVKHFALPRDVVVGRVAFRNLERWSSRKAVLAASFNGVYFAKVHAIVRTGPAVTISVVPADRKVASLEYVRGPGQGIDTGVHVVRLEPCAPSTRAFAYKGTVGPLTLFPGGFIVTRPTCVTIVVTSGKAKPIRRTLSIGAGVCRPSR